MGLPSRFYCANQGCNGHAAARPRRSRGSIGVEHALTD